MTVLVVVHVLLLSAIGLVCWVGSLLTDGRLFVVVVGAGAVFVFSTFSVIVAVAASAGGGGLLVHCFRIEVGAAH